MMTCLDVRRLCLAEPHSHNPRLLLHIYHCKACRQYRQRVLAAEEKIQAGMAVPVPEGLDRKIVFDKEFDKPENRKRPLFLALAASVMVAVVTLASVVGYQLRAPNVVPALVHHMMEDPLHIQSPAADARQRLDEVVRHFGGRVVSSPDILQATLCLIRNFSAAHLVVQGEQGPVTVFVMPRRQVRAIDNVEMDGQVGMVSDYGQGSIALFGYEGESLDIIKARFEEQIRWNAAPRRDRA